MDWKPHPKQKEFLERETDVIFTSSYIHGTAKGAITPEVIRRFMGKYENGQNTQRIETNFRYHPPKDDQPERYKLIRDAAKGLAHIINENTPASREQSLAFTALEEVVMQANAAIARNE